MTQELEKTSHLHSSFEQMQSTQKAAILKICDTNVQDIFN